MPIPKAILDSMRGATLVAILGAGTLAGAAELLVTDPSRPAHTPGPEATPTATAASAIPEPTPTPVLTRRDLLRVLPRPEPPQRPHDWCPACGMG